VLAILDEEGAGEVPTPVPAAGAKPAVAVTASASSGGTPAPPLPVPALGIEAPSTPEAATTSPAAAAVTIGAARRALASGAAQARARVSPAARKRAGELDVDVEALQGTGPGGAVTIEDVKRAKDARARTAATAATPPVPAGATPAAPPEAIKTAPAEATAAPTVRQLSAGMRDAIAAAMSRSKREIPHYYLSAAVDVTVATEWLAAHNAAVPVTARLLFAALLVKAIALTCRATPRFSGFYREGRYEESPAVHVGVAVALRGGGLVAPALMDADAKPVAVLMEDFRALVLRARAGRLRASELAAPTIILTSLGDSAVDAVFPIIQPPQVAIVGAGAVVERPWVVGGKVAPRQVLTLSLGADHRVTDGRLGAQFLARIGERLGRPEALT
jgi:pyruvate dehydrogenase E2 component (dihydrolipoamide acetyltransferase)